MTPEERFTNIERVLERTAEQISKLQVEQAEQSKLQSQQAEQIRNLIANGDKQNEAIRSLIVVSRTVLSSIQEMRAAQEKMIEEARELSKHTDEKLNRAKRRNRFGKFFEIEVAFHAGDELYGISSAQRDRTERISIQVLKTSF